MTTDTARGSNPVLAGQPCYERLGARLTGVWGVRRRTGIVGSGSAASGASAARTRRSGRWEVLVAGDFAFVVIPPDGERIGKGLPAELTELHLDVVEQAVVEAGLDR